MLRHNIRIRTFKVGIIVRFRQTLCLGHGRVCMRGFSILYVQREYIVEPSIIQHICWHNCGIIKSIIWRLAEHSPPMATGQGVVLSCWFAESKVLWTSGVFWMTVVSQSNENCSWQEKRELPRRKRHTFPYYYKGKSNNARRSHWDPCRALTLRSMQSDHTEIHAERLHWQKPAHTLEQS